MLWMQKITLKRRLRLYQASSSYVYGGTTFGSQSTILTDSRKFWKAEAKCCYSLHRSRREVKFQTTGSNATRFTNMRTTKQSGACVALWTCTSVTSSQCLDSKLLWSRRLVTQYSSLTGLLSRTRLSLSIWRGSGRSTGVRGGLSRWCPRSSGCGTTLQCCWSEMRSTWSSCTKRRKTI